MFDRALKLSTHFRLGEFLISETAPELMKGVILRNHEIDKLLYLVQWILQPVRLNFGPVKITSGYRPQSVNAIVGGVATSQHTDAEAADFYCPDVQDMLKVYEWIVNGWFPGEVIYYRKRGHIHVGLPRVHGISNQFIKES